VNADQNLGLYVYPIFEYRMFETRCHSTRVDARRRVRFERALGSAAVIQLNHSGNGAYMHLHPVEYTSAMQHVGNNKSSTGYKVQTTDSIYAIFFSHAVALSPFG
jgi:hypothetical protein